VAPAIVFSLSLTYLDQSYYAMHHDIKCEPAYILPVNALSTLNCRANTYYNMSFDSPIQMYGTELYVTPLYAVGHVHVSVLVSLLPSIIKRWITTRIIWCM
jgi:hypothetical protein